jgi:hypothetical protein
MQKSISRKFGFSTASCDIRRVSGESRVKKGRRSLVLKIETPATPFVEVKFRL